MATSLEAFSKDLSAASFQTSRNNSSSTNSNYRGGGGGDGSGCDPAAGVQRALGDVMVVCRDALRCVHDGVTEAEGVADPTSFGSSSRSSDGEYREFSEPPPPPPSAAMRAVMPALRGLVGEFARTQLRLQLECDAVPLRCREDAEVFGEYLVPLAGAQIF
jgi:hypothetical protein